MANPICRLLGILLFVSIVDGLRIVVGSVAVVAIMLILAMPLQLATLLLTVTLLFASMFLFTLTIFGACITCTRIVVFDVFVSGRAIVGEEHVMKKVFHVGGKDASISSAEGGVDGGHGGRKGNDWWR